MIDISDSRSAESQSVISGERVKSLTTAPDMVVAVADATVVVVVVVAAVVTDADGCCGASVSV